MLVNVITRYPPAPPDMLAATVIENVQLFGVPALTSGGRTLRPSVVNNEQEYGALRIQVAAKQLTADRLTNATAFGSPVVAPVVHESHNLAATAVANINLFAIQVVSDAPTGLSPTTLINANEFGVPSIGVVLKHFSYLNPLGSGDRTAEITVTTSGGSTVDSPMHLVNGNTADNAFWGSGPIAFTFDLGVAKVIRQARWIQDLGTTHDGLFQWQGSNDNVSFDDIGATFNLGGSPVSVQNALLDNNTSYRWYRLLPTPGAAIRAAPYLREIEFYIEGSIDDLPG